jgi:hypothetical protein
MTCVIPCLDVIEERFSCLLSDYGFGDIRLVVDRI